VANALMSMEKKDKRTRSLLVIHKDKIIAEKYDTGFNKTVKLVVNDQKHN
jgi:hypothetical protein